MQSMNGASEDPALYPMQEPLTRVDLMKLRGGLTLWLLTMSVPLLLLVEMRFILVGNYVSPHVYQGVGISALIVLIVSGLVMSMANRAAKNGNTKSILTNTSLTMWLGFAAWILIGIQVTNRTMHSTSHYGETYLVTAGLVDFYLTCLLIAVFAVRSRVKRLAGSLQNFWGVHATTTVWWFGVVAWLVVYLEMYII